MLGILRGFVLFCQHLDSGRAWKMRPFVVFFQGQKATKKKSTVVKVGVVRETMGTGGEGDPSEVMFAGSMDH